MKHLVTSFALLVSAIAYSQKTVVVIGSSTASGYGLPLSTGGTNQEQTNNLNDLLTDSSWANRMREFYTGLNTVQTFKDLAIFGEDCYNGMPTTNNPASFNGQSRPAPDPNNNITKALSFNPDYVLVNFPSNNYDVYSIPEIMACLATIYQTAIANGHTQCYISTTQPRDQFNNANRVKLKTIRDSIMNRFGANAIDFYSIVATSSNTIIAALGQGDGVHLNVAGHRMLWNQCLNKNLIPVTILPITLLSFSAKDSVSSIVFNWKTGIESNMKEFDIQFQSAAGWHTVATVQAKNVGNSSYNYTIFGSTATAGLIGIFLLGGFSFKRKGKGLLSKTNAWLLWLLILIVACRKTNETPTSLQTNNISGNYRLVAVDRDGNLTYSQVVHM